MRSNVSEGGDPDRVPQRGKFSGADKGNFSRSPWCRFVTVPAKAHREGPPISEPRRPAFTRAKIDDARRGRRLRRPSHADPPCGWGTSKHEHDKHVQHHQQE